MRLLPFILVAGVFFIAILFIQKTQPETENSSTPTPTPYLDATPTPVVVDGYSMYMQPITPHTLTLIPNFSQKKTSSEIVDEHACAYGANGGYYTTAGKPLGLFVTAGVQLSAPTTSTAANAFLVKYPDDTLAITQTPPPADAVSFALQAGPYLIPGVTPRITNDEHARRVLIGQTKEGAWHFIVIMNSENAYDGPLLSEIPTLLTKGRTSYTEVLNLDGGTASAFYNVGGYRFGELTMVGSFFCGK